MKPKFLVFKKYKKQFLHFPNPIFSASKQGCGLVYPDTVHANIVPGLY